MIYFSKKYIWLFILILCLLFLIDFLSTYGTYFPLEGLYKIFIAFIAWSKSSLILDILATSLRVFLGFLLACVLGITAGLFMGKYKKIGTSISPVINFIRAITPVALAPFFMLAFGIGETSKILLITWGAFFPIWISTYIGVSSVSEKLKYTTQFLNLKKWEGIKNFWIPLSIQSAYSGMRISVAISFILVYISEMLGASYGVGYKLGVAYDTINLPMMWVALLIFGMLGVLGDKLLVIIIKKYFPWIHPDHKNEN